MGKSYSVDLRLRVLGAVDSGMSKMAAHQLFKVSRSTIDHWLKFWLKLLSETGAVLDRPRQERSKPRALSGPAFSEFVATQQGATPEQMAVAWQRQHGQKLSVMSFSRALAGLGDKGSRLGRAKKSWCYGERDEARRQALRQQLAQVPEGDRVYIDQAGVDDTHCYAYGMPTAGVPKEHAVLASA